jgi:hypothetical protein
MTRLWMERQCKSGSHEFSPGWANVDDDMVEGLVANGDAQPPIDLPPFTELKGLWWMDADGVEHVTWVAYARMQDAAA